MRSIQLLAALTIAAPLQAQAPDSVIRLLEQHTLPAVRIAGQPWAGAPLTERLAYYHTPAVSVAVMDSGKIVWARAWGMADKKTGRGATTETLFQAASISKPLTATAALSLVEERRLSLDADVNQYLKSWQVPASEHAHGQPVTLRRLLTHTAGLTVHGFPGYARSAKIPPPVQVLRGEGNTKPVVVDTTPGARWNYSGGGYTVAQVLLGDVTGLPFATLMQQRVLGPMHLTRSTYQQPLPQARWGEAATGYRPSGDPVEEDWHVYPEQAAAGLWTTPTDLAFRCQITVFFDGKGVAIMTNSDLGSNVAREVLTTLAAVYGWPAFKPVERTVAKVPAATLSQVAGRYRLPDDTNTVAVTLEGDRVFLSYPAFGRVELLPESDTTLFWRDDGTRLTVVRDNGRVVSLRMFGQEARRITP